MHTYMWVCVCVCVYIYIYIYIYIYTHTHTHTLVMHRCTIYALYWSKLWQQDHCQHPQNANPDGSTLEGTAQHTGQRFGGGGAEAQGWGHRQEDPDQGVHQKGQGNHWWNSLAAYLADCQRFRCLTHNCECMCEGGLEV